jgi:hypothetical protein
MKRSVKIYCLNRTEKLRATLIETEENSYIYGIALQEHTPF